MTTSPDPELTNSQPSAAMMEDIDQSVEAMPPVGVTPPQMLAQDAAAGHRGAAWRLLYWIMENDPRAVEAVDSQQDDRLVQHLLEFIALGTWARKHFVVPPPLRSSYARMRLYTLFLPRPSMERVQTERVFLQAAHDQRPALREAALNILGVMGTPNALPVLIDALHDPAHAVRLQAIKGLERLGSADAIPALVQALSGADEQTTVQIFGALEHIGHAALPALFDLSRSHSAWIRWNCIRALIKTYDYRALPALVQALSDMDHGVAWMAAKGLAEFGTSSIEPVLRLLTATEITPWLAETSAYVLSHQRNTQVHPYLAPILADIRSSYLHIGTSYLAYQTLNQMLADGVIDQPSH